MENYQRLLLVFPQFSTWIATWHQIQALKEIQAYFLVCTFVFFLYDSSLFLNFQDILPLGNDIMVKHHPKFSQNKVVILFFRNTVPLNQYIVNYLIHWLLDLLWLKYQIYEGFPQLQNISSHYFYPNQIKNLWDQTLELNLCF